MAPGITLTENGHSDTNGHTTTKAKKSEPLIKSGVLDGAFEFEDITPSLGREYPKANIVDDLLNAPNADDLIRDLAITSKSPSQITKITWGLPTI
jgi:hypothetical protein